MISGAIKTMSEYAEGPWHTTAADSQVIPPSNDRVNDKFRLERDAGLEKNSLSVALPRLSGSERMLPWQRG